MKTDFLRYCSGKKIPFFETSFSNTMAEKFGDNSDELKVLILLLSLKISAGDLLIKTGSEYQQNYLDFIASYEPPDSFLHDTLQQAFQNINNIIEANSSLINDKDHQTPLVISGQDLYLYRYYHLEQNLIKNIDQRMNALRKACNPILTEKVIDDSRQMAGEFNFSLDKSFINAIRMVLTRNISLITGGPGTGKTTLIYFIIRSFLLMAENKEEFKIILCAPTGKAAERMKSSFCELYSRFSDNIFSYFPTEAITMHRLLGLGRKTPSKKMLKADLIIVDESSMIGIELMAELFKKAPVNCQLIFLGDNNQLPAVKGGSLFQDLIAREDNTDHRLGNHTVYLKKSFRSDSAISKCASELVKGNYKDFISHFKKISSLDNVPTNSQLLLLDKTPEKASPALTGNLIFNEKEYLKVLSRQNNFKILCATRSGKGGVNYYNNLISSGSGFSSGYFAGMPIIITENDYENNLFNGTAGTLIHDDTADLKAFFKLSDDRAKVVPLTSLKKYQPAFALTIHQSQGSEYEKVFISLPEYYTPLLTRELLYTAVTRAKKQVIICADESIIEQCVRNTIRRFSALGKHLRKV